MSVPARALELMAPHRGTLTGVLVLLLGALVFLPSLSNPPHPYWDEYYYLSAVQRHVERTATYASHPPLGLMLLSTGPALAGNGKASAAHKLAAFSKITDRDVPAGYSFSAIRLPSAIAAVIGALLFYVIMLRLGCGTTAAAAFSTLYIFENAFVVQFRGAHLDAFQIAFVLAGLLVWLRKREDALTWRDFALFGLFVALAAAVKTNASVLLAIPAFAVARAVWQRRCERWVWQRNVLNIAAALGVFATVTLAVFTLDFALSTRPPNPATEAGRHDLENMGPAYQAYLNGRSGLTFAAWKEAIAGYSARMHNDFLGVTKIDPNGQNPLTWPFYTKSISYRLDTDGSYTGYSTMVGNPIGWRLSLAGILGGLALVVLRRLRRFGLDELPAADFAKVETVLVMYAVFLAAHAYMGFFRVMYIYHHFIGLILGFVALALAFKIAAAAFPEVAKNRNAILGAASMAVALGFAYYAPFSYHRPITNADCLARNIIVVPFTCVGK
jgi:dolichyl-phosphate-mannose-protein mannosyltransferase